MSTMTLEQMRDCLRAYNIDADEYHGKFFAKSMADAVDAHLREHEAAKAGVTDEMVESSCSIYFGIDPWPNEVEEAELCRIAMRAALEAVAPMLASARVPDEKEELDPVKLYHEGRSATEWERGYNEGWNDCRDATLAAAPKRGEG